MTNRNTRYGVMCIPGRAEDGSDSAWSMTTGQPPGALRRSSIKWSSVYVGDGDEAGDRARKRAARLNAGKR